MSYDDATGWNSFDATNTTTALPMYWAGDGEQVEVTAATFPASEMTTGVAVESDQASEDNLNSSDKLRMKATPMDPDPEGITVTLTHLMAKVKLEIDLGEDDDYQKNPLTKVTIGGTELKRTCAETTTGYEFTDLTASTVGDITPYTGAFTATTKTTTSKTNAKARYEAILVPQTAKAGTFTVSLTLEGGKEFLWTAGADVELKSNYEYTLSLRLYGDKLLLGDVSVDAWGSDKLDGGVVEEYIPEITVTAGQLSDATEITKALDGCWSLKIAGTLSVNDLQALGSYSVGTIKYLDLTEAEVEGGDYGNIMTKLLDGSGALASNIVTLKLPDNMATMAAQTLYNCKALQSVTLPAKLTSIAGIYLPSTLTELAIPAGVTTINEQAFIYNSNLKKVTFLGKGSSIGEKAFLYCSALTEIDMPSVTSIGNKAFSNCSALTKVNLPSVTSIGEGAFESCPALTKVNLPSVTSIGKNAFLYCSVLTEINMPSVTSIGEDAFESCPALTKVNLPSTVTNIPRDCFSSCSKLTTVTCDGDVTSIGGVAFVYCKNLKDLYLKGCSKLPELGSNAFSGVSQKVTVHLSSDLNDNVTSDANYSAWESVATFTAD